MAKLICVIAQTLLRVIDNAFLLLLFLVCFLALLEGMRLFQEQSWTGLEGGAGVRCVD